MTTQEGMPSLEQDKAFTWRSYLRYPEKLTPSAIEKLDMIEAQLNDPKDPEMVEIKKELQEGIADRSFREPIGALVNLFRPYLNNKEKSELNSAVREAGDWNPIR